jgi:hypothetical protein
VKLALRLLVHEPAVRVPVGLLDDLNVDDQILWSKDGEPLTTNGECPRIGGPACGHDKEGFFGPETT